MTEPDKAQCKEVRSEFAPQKLLGQLLAMFGSLFLMAAFGTVIYSNPDGKVRWGLLLFLSVFGVFLILCAALLLKASWVENKPPLWFPTVSGIACSCSVLISGICIVSEMLWKVAHDSDLFTFVFVFAIGASVVSAIVCIVTGIPALRCTRPESDSEDEDR
jgi:hypothetical protein